ncbi:hypothetical protein ANCCEY_06922 [Ancylostoma ceylanicum]|uniref:Receptor ligand binding region domain-containing protein n=1 Tax=Ancylostoma ceylanicum TaxID=53326 RepID=A0A0D6LS17_9BILA|nr:hypothetical protein ANCCEY_06922 [Ancylostoma ceylanicum]
MRRTSQWTSCYETEMKCNAICCYCWPSKKLRHTSRYVPPDSMAVTYRDSRLSDAHGPNVAIQQLVKNRLDCIIGYAFVYALAPVARMCPYWQDDDSNGIPVITPIGLTMNLDNKMEYQTLTRISGPYKVVAQSVVALFKYHNWTRHVFLFNHVKDAAMGVGECYLLMASIQMKIKQIIKMEHNFFTFNQNEKINRSQMKNYLMQSSFLGKGQNALGTCPVLMNKDPSTFPIPLTI